MKNNTVIVRTAAELAQINRAELQARILDKMATLANYTSLTPVLDLLLQDLADQMALQGNPVVSDDQVGDLVTGILRTWQSAKNAELNYDFKSGQIVTKKPETATKAETKSNWVVEADKGDHLVVKAVKGPKKDCFGFWNKSDVLA